MRYPAKLLSLATLAVLLATSDVTASQRLDFSEASGSLLAQTDPTGNVLLEVDGVLKEGDEQLNDGSLYDVYPFEGQAGQSITIRLESQDFDTYLLLFDSAGEQLASNDDSAGNTNSQLTFTLQDESSYQIVANAFDRTGRGHYRLVVTEATQTEANRGEADQLLQQGIQLYHANQFREALRPLESALVVYQEIGDSQREAHALTVAGLSYFFLGQSERAVDFHQRSLAIARETDNLFRESASLSNLGMAYNQLSQYERAIDFYQQSLAIDRAIGDRQGEGDVLGNLGLTYYSLGQYERAIDFHQQSLAIDRAIGDRRGEALSLGNLGIAYRALGQYERAIDLHQQQLEIDREVGHRWGEANALGNLGLVYYSVGQYGRAISFYQQQLTIVREIGNRVGESGSLSNLGNAHIALGDYDRAIDFHQQSLAIDRATGDIRGESASLGNLGTAHYFIGQYERAIDFDQQYLDIARAIGSRQDEANALGNLGSTYLFLRQYEQALDFFQQQLVITQEIGDRSSEAIALNNQGAAFISSSQFVRAERVLQQSIETYESLRTGLSDDQLISIADTQAQAYANLERALTAQNKTAEALVITERGRGRAFVLQLASRLATEAERAALDASPVAQAPTVAEIQQIARDTKTTLVTYSQIFDRSLYIWVVQPTGDIEFRSVDFDGSDGSPAINPIAAIDGPVYRSATPESELTALVNDSRATVIVEGAGTDPQQLQDLHQILIDPIADLLPSDPDANVAFIPQGNLFLVPFAALQDENGTYLIEKHTILTAPSIQVFGLANASNEPDSASLLDTNPLVVGNPVMPTVWSPTASGEFADIQLSDLPGAEREAVAIGNFFQRPALIGDQATEARIKQLLPDASLIHLATHGLLEYGIPESSGVLDLPGAIALTPGDGEDGLLTSAEILNLDLQADLAILSACDTGRGRITGDGVVGLSRALITAGVPSVMVSLWAVPDAPTAELMTEFYNQLAQGQDNAQALRQAMLITMQQHPEPRNWAAFTLLGAAE